MILKHRGITFGFLSLTKTLFYGKARRNDNFIEGIGKAA